VINSSSQVVVIDRKTGRVVRRIALDVAASCAGATDGTYFFGGTGQGLFFAVSLEQALRSWTASTGYGITAPLESSGGYLYVASRDGTIRAVKGGRSEDTRKKVLGGPVTAAFYVDSRVCLVPCEDHLLYSFSSDLGQRVWDQPFVCGGPLRTPVQVGERTVYQRAQGDKFYAISLASGRQRCTLPTGQQVLAVIGSDVHVRDTQGGLLVVDEVTGAVKKSASLAGLDLFVGNATDPSIWAGKKDGRVVCLRPLSAGRLSAETLKKTQK
jgi:outer membrane protein assembly factor BamB